MNGGAVDPWAYRYKNAGTVPITSGSAVFPSVPSFEVTEIFEFKQTLDKENDKELIKKLNDDTKDYIDWQTKQYKKNYERQAKYGVIIFWLVIGLVFSGIVFSAIQFWHALKFGDINQMNNELILSMSNLQVQTSLMGGFVLVISLVFFFLFLKFVYRITPPSNFVTTEIREAKKNL